MDGTAEDRVQQVIAKIERLLALAERGTEGEAAAALAAVQRLMERHHLDQATLDAGRREAVDDEWDDETIAVVRRWDPEHRAVCEILSRHFRVAVVTARRRGVATSVLIFGRPCDLAVAQHVAVVLCRRFRAEWRAHRRRFRRASPAHFYAGLRTGLSRKLDEATREERGRSPLAGALLVNDERLRLQALERHWGALPTAVPRPLPDGDEIAAQRDQAAGYAAGRTIDLHPALRSEAEVTSRLPALPAPR